MSDSVKAWHEMQEEVNKANAENYPEFYKPAKYIFLLDFTDGKVYRYDLSLIHI